MKIDGYGYAYGYSSKSSNGTGNGYGSGYSNDNGYGGNSDGHGVTFLSGLYRMTPFAYLTYEGYPQDDTFDSYMFHLQVEQLVHRARP